MAVMAAWLLALALQWEVAHRQDIISHADEAVAYLAGEGGVLTVACDDQSPDPIISLTLAPNAIELWGERDTTVWIRFGGDLSPARQVWVSYRGSIYAGP